MKTIKTLLKVLGGLVLALALAVIVLALSLRSTIPEESFELRAETAASAEPVLIFGATRNTGYEVARLLRRHGRPVTAAVRESSDRSLLEPLGVEFVIADALDDEAVRQALRSRPFGAVVSTVGCMRCDPPPDFIGNRNIVDAARTAGVDRVVLISTVGAGDSYDAANLLSQIALRDVLPLKTRAEDHLRESGLDYTIIRPGGLRPNDRPSTGAGMLTEDRTALGFIHRADLAGLIVSILDDERTYGRTYAALDRTVMSPWE